MQSLPVNLFLVVAIVLGREGEVCLIPRLTQTYLSWCWADSILVQYMLQVSHSVFSFEEEVSQNCLASVWSCTTPGHPQ